jgi:hypothetical protein
MATNFPGGIDTFVNPNATSSLDSPSHAGLHTDMGDAMTAVQTQLVNQPTGLVHINTTSFSAVATQSVDNVFSSSYTNYLIKLNLTGWTSSDADLTLRFRASGTDTSAGYSSQRLRSLSGVVDGANNVLGTGAANLYVDIGTAYPTYTICDVFIYRPNLAQITNFRSECFSLNSLNTPVQQRHQGYVDGTVQYDGFTLLASAGNMTGNFQVYGFRI